MRRLIEVRTDRAGICLLHARPQMYMYILDPDRDRGAGALLYMEISPTAHRMIADRCRIPWRYYERMLERAPDLLSANVKHWWSADPELRTVVLEDGVMVGWYPVPAPEALMTT